jgi:acetyl-CoA carboxylase biotin carboxyl carrier protein
MDLKKVKELIDLMKDNDLVEVTVEAGDSKIHLKAPGANAPMMHAAPMPMPAAPAAAPVAAPVVAAEEGLEAIGSPIVGTFYHASSPDAEPYVRVGDKVTPETVVCIIEAMKVMNEIKAETTGTIVEVCCKDGQAVEYGQPLYRIR